MADTDRLKEELVDSTRQLLEERLAERAWNRAASGLDSESFLVRDTALSLLRMIAARLPFEAWGEARSSLARRLGIEDAGIARVTFAGGTIDLPARTQNAFPVGAVGLPVGMPGIPPFDAGSPCSVGAGD